MPGVQLIDSKFLHLTTSAALAVFGNFTDRILSLPGWGVVVAAFALPAMEASAFVGFIFPGELAVLLGGVLASQGRVPLVAIIAAAIMGAIVGDTIGYWVGRRFGERILRHTVGRLVKAHHLERAEAYLRRLGGKAVFFGRFTAALRVLVPGLAGMSRMPYRTFLAYNVAGAVVWAAAFAVLGYVAGVAWQYVARIASLISLFAFALVLLGFLIPRIIRSRWLESIGRRIVTSSLADRIRQRFPQQVRWLGHRLDPAEPNGLQLTLAVLGAILCAWAVGGLTQDVLSNEESVLLDPRAMTLAIEHRADWLSTAMQIVTLLASVSVLAPLVALSSFYFASIRKDWATAANVIAAAIGGLILFTFMKHLIDRPRPPAALMLTPASVSSFPSGHSTEAVAVYGMLAYVLSRGRSHYARALWWGAAAMIALLVGASRIYLGDHWLTDVLAGYGLGGFWLFVLIALTLSRRRTKCPG